MTDVSERLRDISAVTDAALSRLDEETFLRTLIERVKTVLDADTAAVYLLDHSARDLIAAAASGLEEEVSQGIRIPLGSGFTGRVATSRAPVTLYQVDSTTVRSPILAGRGIKALLGVPMFVGGQVIGVMHVGSFEERVFSAEDEELLQLAAERAASAVQTMLAQEDRQAAMAMQGSLLPSALPEVPGVDLAARYVTGSGIVGGDWYDVFVLPDGRLGIVVGDVTGSGLAAAVIMGRMRSALRAYVLETADPAVALSKLDRKMQYFEPDAMATVLYGIYEPGTGTLTLSSAGHPPPVLAAPGWAGARLAEIEADLPIGVIEDPKRRSSVIVIPPGGTLCFYTDGLVERRGQSLDEGFARLTGALSVFADPEFPQDAAGAENVCAIAMRTMVGHEHARDDIAILALRREP